MSERVRTVKELFCVLCWEAAPAEAMRSYLFDLPTEMPAQEAWESCADDMSMVYVAGLLGVPSDVLVGIGMECARLVVDRALPESVDMLRIAEEVVAGDMLAVWASEFVRYLAHRVREMDAETILIGTKCAATAVHAAARAVMESRRDRMIDRVCEAVQYAGKVDGAAVLGIVRERLPWAVMSEALEGLWGTETAPHPPAPLSTEWRGGNGDGTSHCPAAGQRMIGDAR